MLKKINFVGLYCRFMKQIRILLIVIPLLAPQFLMGQVMEFDKLEMHYHQGHYKMVYRKANRLIDNPAYDYSYLPRYYRSLAMLQLAQSKRWLKRNKNAIDEAEGFLVQLNKTQEGKALLRAHKYELSSLKNDLKQWAGDLKLQNRTAEFQRITALLKNVFEDIPYVHDLEEDNAKPDTKEIISPDTDETIETTDVRTQLITEARKYIGVPYKWAGNTPNGFDCSGFTSYLIKTTLVVDIQRRAADQYTAAKKVKRKHVQPGDFVFFDNGSGISHVGMVISTENDQIQMIHSSTSIGISIVNIDTSSYWKGRVVGFGTFL